MVNSTTRFLAVDSTKVDLKERKDKLNNSKTEYLSLDDIRGYKVYTALLTQTGTDAPVATVLENTLGEITFEYIDLGIYKATSVGLFTLNKSTSLPIGIPDSIGFGFAQISDENDIFIVTNDFATAISTNDILNSSFIEIRVYN